MSQHQAILNKLFSLSELQQQREDWRHTDEQVVFTNGCFDILHRGHVEYLSQAADHGSKLILGLNSDASVKQLNKGDNRPVNPEIARAVVLAGLQFIDAVVIFGEDTPQTLIESLTPDVLVKGGDYDASITDPNHPQYIVGSASVRESGGTVITIPLVEGFSTTAIIEKMKAK